MCLLERGPQNAFPIQTSLKICENNLLLTQKSYTVQVGMSEKSTLSMSALEVSFKFPHHACVNCILDQWLASKRAAMTHAAHTCMCWRSLQQMNVKTVSFRLQVAQIRFFLLICDSGLFVLWQCEQHGSHGIWFPFWIGGIISPCITLHLDVSCAVASCGELAPNTLTVCVCGVFGSFVSAWSQNSLKTLDLSMFSSSFSSFYGSPCRKTAI